MDLKDLYRHLLDAHGVPITRVEHPYQLEAYHLGLHSAPVILGSAPLHTHHPDELLALLWDLNLDENGEALNDVLTENMRRIERARLDFTDSQRFIRSAIDGSYKKSQTKFDQVDAIASAVWHAIEQLQLPMFRKAVPIDDGVDWVVAFECGHEDQVSTEDIREHGIWPVCERCRGIQAITSAQPIDYLP